MASCQGTSGKSRSRSRAPSGPIARSACAAGRGDSASAKEVPTDQQHRKDVDEPVDLTTSARCQLQQGVQRG